jgi:RNA polymerase sigma-70 factor (ECF subfamily)
MAMARCDARDAEQPVIEAIRARDPYAFEELVRRHHGWVRAVVFGVLGDRDDVDDVVQQVWTSVWERIGELRDAGRWRSWIYRLARNAAVDAGRQRTRRRKAAQALPADAIPAMRVAEGPATNVEREERHAAVLRAIRALPALYREPFVLRHVSGWSYRDIAEAMDMPVDSVETRLVRARRFLRELLKDGL